MELRIETELPGLIHTLMPILNRIKRDCPDTKTAIAYAREIVEALRQRVEAAPVVPAPMTSGEGDVTRETPGDESGDGIALPDQSPENSRVTIINSLLNRSSSDLPQGLGEALGRILNDSKTHEHDGMLRVAQVCPRNFEELPPGSLEVTRQTTKALKYKLQSRLQAMTLKKIKPGYYGRLDPKTIHKLFVADPKIFRQSGVRVGHNTAVHLLIDASGSMQSSINLVSLTAYSLCSSLSEVSGINVGASVFPGTQTRRIKDRDKSWETISPILRHGQAMHRRFQLEAEGGTPMGEAIWWALQEMAPLRENRKIIMVLTDGEPDYIDNTKAAIDEAKRLGYELYGLGIGDTSIKTLLPGQSIEITHLSELPQKLFELLGQAMNRSR